MSQRRSIAELETVAVTVPEPALEAYEAALSSACDTVGFFRDHATGDWRVEGVKTVGHNDEALAGALALAAAVTGTAPNLDRSSIQAEGWLARTYASFPEQRIGRRFAVRGTHLTGPSAPGRISLTLDAGVAFGSGEHGSTRGCLIALETVARRRPRRILDMGTGSGILAMAAVKLLHRKVLATDIEPWSVRVTQENAGLNQIAPLIRVRLANGWRNPAVRAAGPYDLVFGNILARPLCAMAKDLAANLAPGGTAILAGLLGTQARMVLAAHRRQGLRLVRMIPQGTWTTLIVRRSAARRV
jgi:ribosomal protein L11 methyltransferase